MSALELLVFALWMTMLVLSGLLLERATRRLMQLLRERHSDRWEALGSPRGIVDIVCRHHDRRFNSFMEARKYLELDSDVAARFEKYVSTRDRWLRTLALFSVLFMLYLVFGD